MPSLSSVDVNKAQVGLTLMRNALSREEFARVVCALARVGSLLCDVAGVSATGLADSQDEPYIWDLEE